MNEKNRSLIISLAFAGLLAISPFVGRIDPWIAFFIFTTWFSHGYLFGKRLAPHEPFPLSFIWGWLCLIAVQSTILTAWYYAGGSLLLVSGAWSLALAVLVLQGITWNISNRTDQYELNETSEHKQHGFDMRSLFLCAALFLITLLAISFVLWNAWQAQTTEAIRTPWPLLAHGTILALVLAWFASFFLAQKKSYSFLAPILSSLSIAPLTFIAPLLYKLGFGFDGFLHTASENIILQTGTLTPHPPAYIGQYVFTTLLSRLSSLPVAWIDTWLVPVTALFLPFAFFIAFPKLRALSVSLAALLIPWSVFMATTPQSFAYLLGLLALSGALAYPRLGAIIPIALAGWALAVHPLAGAPFLCVTLVLLLMQWRVQHKKNPLRNPLIWMGFAATLLVIPVAFFILGQGQNTIHWNLSILASWKTYVAALNVFLPPITRLSLWADWAAFVSYLTPLTTLLLACIACFKKEERRPQWVMLSLLSLGLIVTGFILRVTGDFSFLVDYERSNYADRLFILAQWFFLFPAVSVLTQAVQRLFRGRLLPKITLVLFFGFWYGAQTYLTLPRHDATIIGHGWSVGQADMEAVRWIEQDAGGEPYTVLANQSTSAAAVATFGFKRYADSIFFYPIPTGGPLYQVYLHLTQQTPTLDDIRRAGELGKSRLVYVVLNEYWWQTKNTAAWLNALAEKTKTIENGKIQIYRFEANSSIKR